MPLYIIRHTSVNISKSVCYGQSDVDLTENFEEEANAVLAQLPEKIGFIFSSDLSRCVRLSEKIKQKYDVEITIDERLREMNFGDWEMKNWDDIPSSELDVWMNDFVFEKAKNGESLTILSQRIGSFLQEINEKCDTKKNIVIVTHAGAIRAFLHHIKGIALKDVFNTKVNYGEIFIL